MNDDPACATHLTPAAALDPTTGKVHVIWAENRAGTGSVAYAACATGGEKCGKNELVSDTPFAAFELQRHARRKVADRGWHHADIDHVDAGRTQPVRQCLDQFRTRQATVARDDYSVAALCTHFAAERTADRTRCIGIERLADYAANVICLENRFGDHVGSLACNGKF